MVALLTPACSATASMLTADRPHASRRSAAAARIAWWACSLRGRPRGAPSVVIAWSRRLRLGTRESVQYLEQAGDVAASVTQLLGPAQYRVSRRRGRQREVTGACGVQGQPDVLVHHPHVEPRLLRQIESERGPGAQHRRTDRGP